MKRWCGVLLLAVLAAILFATAAPPTLGDYAEWTYHGVLLHDVLRGHPDAAYLLKTYPVPNSLTTVGLGLMMLVLPWAIAAKLWLLGEVGLGMVAIAWLRRAAAPSAGRQGWALLILAPGMLLGIAFWAGFSNFLLGTYLAMMLCALLLQGRRQRLWVLGALLGVIFFSHMIAYGFALLVLGLYAQQTRRWRLLWSALPSGLLSVWYFAGRAWNGDADAKAGMESSVAWGTPLFAAFKANTFLKCWGFINPASGEADSILLRLAGAKLFVALFLVNLVIGAALLVLLGAAAWRSLHGRDGQRFLWLALAGFFVVSLTMPGAAAGISDPGGRMMQIAVWCGACMVTTRRRALGLALTLCALVLLVNDGILLHVVAMRPPTMGTATGALPARLRTFAHIYYADRWPDYAAIRSGLMEQPIYPTALFLKR